MLELRAISKSFHDGESELQVLDGIDLELGRGDSMALLGASGSGKSTLLQIAAGLDEPDAGEVCLLGQISSALRELSASCCGGATWASCFNSST